MIPMPAKGLYAITDHALTRARGLAPCVEEALRGGATMVQYRDKTHDRARRREEAAALLELCHRFGAPLVINDDVDLALEVGADGVHVGREDAAVATARARLGPDAIVGASCYHDLGRAGAACRAGASYVAFGRFFTSATKPGQALATPALLGEARSSLPVPLVAIGGIRAENGAALVRAGADLLAVIHDLWTAPDRAARAKALAACWQD
jgi:thiamine-phosphate pyrophosphorylase